MAYKKIGWKDYPSTDTPINATNLEHMDAGILENAQTIGDKTKISDIGDGTVAGAIAANTAEIEQNTQSLTLKNQIKIKTITKVITSSSGNINTGIPSTNNVLIARSAWDDNAAFIITPFASPQNQTWFLNCKDSSGNIYSNQPIGVIIYYY